MKATERPEVLEARAGDDVLFHLGFGRILVQRRCSMSLARQCRCLLSIPELHYSSDMIRDWFDAGEAVAFARGIARDVDWLFPRTPQKRNRASAKKEQKKLDDLVLRTRTFAQQHKLNFYKKAKFLNTIKWELKDAGHEEALIDEIVALLAPLLHAGMHELASGDIIEGVARGLLFVGLPQTVTLPTHVGTRRHDCCFHCVRYTNRIG